MLRQDGQDGSRRDVGGRYAELNLTNQRIVRRSPKKVVLQNRPQVRFSFRNMMQWVQLEHPQLAEVW